YQTAFPFSGMPLTEDTYQHDGTTLVSHASFVNIKTDLDTTAGNQRAFVFTQSANAQSYEVGGTKNGLLISTVTTNNSYDNYGNVNSVTVTGAGMGGRTTLTNWGTTGQFPATTTNPLTQTTQFGYDFNIGALTSSTDPNGIATTWHYDTFGRKTREDRADGT